MEGVNNRPFVSAHPEVAAPCKDCPNRHAACHDDCNDFAEYKAKLEKIKKAEAKAVRERWLGAPSAPRKRKGGRK